MANSALRKDSTLSCRLPRIALAEGIQPQRMTEANPCLDHVVHPLAPAAIILIAVATTRFILATRLRRCLGCRLRPLRLNTLRHWRDRCRGWCRCSDFRWRCRPRHFWLAHDRWGRNGFSLGRALHALEITRRWRVTALLAFLWRTHRWARRLARFAANFRHRRRHLAAWGWRGEHRSWRRDGGRGHVGRTAGHATLEPRITLATEAFAARRGRRCSFRRLGRRLCHGLCIIHAARKSATTIIWRRRGRFGRTAGHATLEPRITLATEVFAARRGRRCCFRSLGRRLCHGLRIIHAARKSATTVTRRRRDRFGRCRAWRLRRHFPTRWRRNRRNVSRWAATTFSLLAHFR